MKLKSHENKVLQYITNHALNQKSGPKVIMSLYFFYTSIRLSVESIMVRNQVIITITEQIECNYVGPTAIQNLLLEDICILTFHIDL